MGTVRCQVWDTYASRQGEMEMRRIQRGGAEEYERFSRGYLTCLIFLRASASPRDQSAVVSMTSTPAPWLQSASGKTDFSL